MIHNTSVYKDSTIKLEQTLFLIFSHAMDLVSTVCNFVPTSNVGACMCMTFCVVYPADTSFQFAITTKSSFPDYLVDVPVLRAALLGFSHPEILSSCSCSTKL